MIIDYNKCIDKSRFVIRMLIVILDPKNIIKKVNHTNVNAL